MSLRVLLVDDEPGLLDLAKEYLEKEEDLKVVTMSSASDALERMDLRSFHAIVSGYHMPDIDGIEYLRILRSNNLKVPFILFTGRGREEVAIEALNQGADFYLRKGGDPQAQFAELINMIKQSVSRMRTEMDLYERVKELDYLYRVSRLATSTSIGEMLRETVRILPSGFRQPGAVVCRVYFSGMELTDERYVETEWHLSSEIVVDGRSEGTIEVSCLEEPADDRPFLEERRLLEGVACLLGNMIARTRTREGLERMSRFLSAVVDNANELIEVFDRRGNVVIWNRGAEWITGFKKEDIIGGDRVWGLLYPDEGERKRYMGRFYALMKGGEDLAGYESTIYTRGGERRIISWYGTAIKDPSGDLMGVLGIGHDITQRKAAHESLARSEASYRTIFENTGTAMMVLEEDMAIHMVNERLSQIFGYQKEEIEGRMTILDLAAPHDRERVRRNQSNRRREGGGLPGSTSSIAFTGKAGFTNAY